MFVDNNWYGQRYILSKYCNIKDTNAFAAIQHGMLTRSQEELLGARRFSFIPYLCWNQRVFEKLKFKGLKNVQIIGSPFIYLDKILNKKNNLEQNGTIVFPSKSTYEKKREVNYKLLINESEKMFPGPYTVSIYHADLNNDLSEFKRRNWKIVSFGKRSDKNFLIKNYLEILKNKNIICTSINTVFFYASYLKKNIKFLIKKNDNDIVLTKDQNQLLTQNLYNEEYPGILSNKLSRDQLYEIAKRELGFEHFKRPDELIELLGWNNKSKIILSYLISSYMDFKHYLIYKKSLRND